MDSISHTRVANLLLAYIKSEYGISFDENAFRYGNLKPDLTGTYLTKRHYPSIMFDEVMDKIRTFLKKYTIEQYNGKDLSIDLGEICHYLTDFFCYPHNDDIYNKSLLAHYIYEKRIALCLKRKLTEQDFDRWVQPIIPPLSEQALISRIQSMHNKYKTQTVHHCIDNDLVYICQICAMLVGAVINISYVPVSEPITASI